MHGQQQRMIVIRQLHEPPADHRPPLEVEGLRGFVRSQPMEFGLRVVGVAQIVFLQVKAVLCRLDDLDRTAVDLGESGAQSFVARDNAIKRSAQGLPIEIADQSEATRHVVSYASSLEL